MAVAAWLAITVCQPAWGQVVPTGRTAAGSSVRKLVLDPLTVFRIPVAQDRLTSIRFPSPISHLEAALVAAEPHPQALFQVYFHAGESFLSVKALKPQSATSLNVVWKQQTYVLELVESSNSWLSVIFDTPPPAKAPDLSVRRPTPERLAARLETAKNFGRLRREQPSALLGIRVSPQQTKGVVGDLSVTLAETYQFPAENIVVCLLVISNPTLRTYRFDPASLAMQVPTLLYSQAATDTTGVLPPQTATKVYLAVAGDAEAIAAALSAASVPPLSLSFLSNADPAPPVPKMLPQAGENQPARKRPRRSWWQRNFDW